MKKRKVITTLAATLLIGGASLLPNVKALHAEEIDKEKVEDFKQYEDVIKDTDIENPTFSELDQNETTFVEDDIDGVETLADNPITIDATNFPDADFLEFVKKYDSDRDNQLSSMEINKVTTISIPSTSKIKDITGIKNFTELSVFYCSGKEIAAIDISGMQKIKRVDYGSANLKTLDFRNCPNLEVGWHSSRNETVYISAGMTKYIGCDAIPEHTGNIVIDLNGYFTVNSDGSKSVNLDTVISGELIKVLAAENNPNFDNNSHILTIPAGEAKTIFQAGETFAGEKTQWTFYTNMTAVDDCSISYDSMGGSVVQGMIVNKGTVITQPNNPTRLGYIFDGWFTEKTYQNQFDFTTPINADITLYAKWTATNFQSTLIYDGNGGTWQNEASKSLNIQNPETISLDMEIPVRKGYQFKGWTTVKDDKNTLVTEISMTDDKQIVTVYALWEKDVAQNRVVNTGDQNRMNIWFASMGASSLILLLILKNKYKKLGNK